MDNPTNPTNPTLPSNDHPYIVEIDAGATAIELRLRGFRYYQIAEELQNAGFTTTEMTLESWFAKGGKCHEEFQRRRAVRTRELQQRLDEVEQKLKEAAIDALTLLHQNIVKKDGLVDPDRAKVAQDILDRAGYPKQSKTDFTGQIESESMNNMANAIKSVLESKQPVKPAVVVPIVEGQIVK